MTHTYKFYKDEFGWFIDLPEVIESGLFTKDNLQMVAGADDLLQRLSINGENVTLEFSDKPFDGYEDCMMMSCYGMDTDELDEYGLEIGAFYSRKSDGFVIWLCPVTRYVFDGEYPQDIYFKVL